MTGTVPMGRNMDRFESATGTRTQQAHGAWGADCFGSAKLLARGSFGAYTESTPPERASDDQFCDRVNRSH